MYALAQRAVGGLKTCARVAKSRSSLAHQQKKIVRERMGRVIVRFAANTAGPGGILKLEGQAALPQKLEDPIFRREYILNPQVPPGRDIWNDNPRLDIRYESDPLTYTWPEGEDFSSYDPVLKRNWEDAMFEAKWQGKTKGQVQGGDWANTRISTEVPPRIKIYYANIVKKMQEGHLIAATIAFNALLTDYLAPRGSIPYGVYHTMMVIYKARDKLSRAYDMFHEIVSHHTPSPDDYAIGLEILLALKRPKTALDLWRSFQTRPSMAPNAAMYIQLLRTYAMIGDIEKLKVSYSHVISKESKEFYTPVLTAMIQIYAELGYQKEVIELAENITPSFGFNTRLQVLESLTQAGLYDEALEKYSAWGFKMDGAPYATNVLIKCFTEKRDVTSLEKVLNAVNSGQIGVLDMTAYGYIIAKHRQMGGESDIIARAVQQGLGLQTLRASIRNYRAARTANILAHANSSFAPAQTAIEDLASKEIAWDAAFFEAVALAQQSHQTVAQALETWNQQVVQLKLVPTRMSFTYFFNLAGMERQLVSTVLVWRLALALKVKPDLRFASALSLALNPNRNYFGLIKMRAAHQKWTENPTSPRVLDMNEIKDFTEFIDHAVSTFTEEDQKALELAWKKMYKNLCAPRPVEVQENVSPSKPIYSQTADVVRRIFSSTLPEPSNISQADAIAADVTIDAESVAQEVSLETEPLVESAEQVEKA
jgi:hypothetical protein